MSGLHDLTVTQLVADMRSKRVSAVEAAKHFLARSAEHQSLGAFLAVNESVTLAQARAADERIAKGDDAPLLGVPIAHKDIFVTKDFPTTAGSKILEGYRSPFDATVVSQLTKAGCVTLGKLNCDEFAMGSSNENSAYGPTRNPWDTSRVPGGSSGGSAVAVSARLALATTATDTGGSIRQPAALCGVTGIKPTYGRVSRYGMVAFASSLDQAGPIARTAEDCALILNSICGVDADRDSTSLDVPTPDFRAQLNESLEGIRVGIPREWMRPRWDQARDGPEGTSLDVLVAVEEALIRLERLGAKLVPISLPLTELSIPVYYLIAPAEASSNLARFDGVKFGKRAKEYVDLLDMYKKTRGQGFGDEVKRRIMIGTYVLSHGYYDAYYLQAQKIRRMIADDFRRALTDCDVIAGPVAPSVAWHLGEHNQDPLADYFADIFTLPASLAGLPGMSIPCGFGKGRMPVGLQLVGNYFTESLLLNVAHRFQQETDFHLRKPPIAEPPPPADELRFPADEVGALLRQPESELLEKRLEFDEESVARTICAFSNALNVDGKAGILVLGAGNDLAESGIEVTGTLLDQIEQIRFEGRVQPLPDFSVEPVRFERKSLVLVRVRPSAAPPVRLNQIVWVRKGGVTTRATPEDEAVLNEMRRARDHSSFDAEPLPGCRLDDLDLKYFVDEYAPSALPHEELPSDSSDLRAIAQKLVTTKMAVDGQDVVPTVAGMLTLGLSPQDTFAGAYVQFVRYQGMEQGDEIVDQERITGNLQTVILRTEEKIRAHIRTGLQIAGSARERALPDYPFDALQQLFRNSVLHRNYEGTNSPIRVYWFEDRVEIWNPGGPFGSVTAENFGEPYATDYRNPILAEVLSNLKFVQRFGYGIQSARKWLAANGNPELLFKLEKGFVLATVRRRNS